MSNSVGFCFRRTGHARQLLEHAEIILEGNGRERLVLALDLDAFLGFDRLVQAVGPAPSRHHASRKLVDDDDFAVFDDVFHVLAIERVRLDRGLDVMLERPVLRVSDVANTEQAFDFLPAFIRHRDVAVLLVDDEIAGELRGFARGTFDLLAFFQLGNDSVDLVVLVGRFFARAGNDQRRTGFVDQNGIDFVDDGVVVPALHAILDVELHVVAQVVEAELVVGAVGDVCRIGGAALFVVQIVNDHADRKSEEAVQPSHPLRVAFGQVVVDRTTCTPRPLSALRYTGRVATSVLPSPVFISEIVP